MAKKLEDVLSALPAKRRSKITNRAAELATLRDLHVAASQTQADMAQALGVRQHTISRLKQKTIGENNRGQTAISFFSLWIQELIAPVFIGLEA